MTIHQLQDGTSVTLTGSTTLEEWRDRQVAWHRDSERTGTAKNGGVSKAFIQGVINHYTPADREEA